MERGSIQNRLALSFVKRRKKMPQRNETLCIHMLGLPYAEPLKCWKQSNPIQLPLQKVLILRPAHWHSLNARMCSHIASLAAFNMNKFICCVAVESPHQAKLTPVHSTVMWLYVCVCVAAYLARVRAVHNLCIGLCVV